MRQAYSRKDLRNQSFRGQDLEGSDFSYSNISGSDFTQANLKGVNFSHCTTGLKPNWLFIVQFLILFFVSLSILFQAYLGAFFGSILPTPESFLGFLVVFIFALTTLLGFIFITIFKGVGKELGLFALIIVTFVAICVILPGVSHSRGNIILLAILVAVYVAGASMGSIALAITRIMPKTLLSRLVIPAIFFMAPLGMYLGVEEIEEISEIVIALIIAIPIFSLLLGLTFYIAFQATSGNKKYEWIQKIAVFILSMGGTSFYNSNLSDANFTEASLEYSDFRAADLTRTCWLNSRQMELARIDQTYLMDPEIRKLAISKQAKKVKFDNIRGNLNLENALLEETSFVEANLSDANLRGVTCINGRFDEANLHSANLENAELQDSSFIGADLSQANLQNANLSGAKLVRTQLYEANLTGANLTGVFIQDWGISGNTKLDQIKCTEIFMQLPTRDNKYDPCRKPDAADEYFQEDDFIDFITPLRDTLKEYREKYFDPRQKVRIIDIPHRGGIDSLASAIALKELTDRYPQAGIEVISLRGGRDKIIFLQIKVTKNTNQSQISTEYKDRYREVSSFSQQERKILVGSLNRETNDCINSLGNIIETVTNSRQIYLETEINFLTQKRILLLAANPLGIDQRRLDAEVREIQAGLERAKKRDEFQIIAKWAVRIDDLRRALLDYEPHIVHFSGFGAATEGLALENDAGQLQLVSNSALADLFEVFKDSVECVLLNACYSLEQAEAIRQHIPYVIGMSQAIGNQAALEFAVGFYDAIGAGRSIEDAFKLGCISIELKGIPESLTPVIKRKDNSVSSSY
jgi:uncharacterized protein YjbI with pentapeptide repeats